MNRQDPEHLGQGLGALLADALPFMPSGLRRTGAARLMAERIGERPGWTTRNPILSQLLGIALGGGAYLATGNKLVAAAPLAAVQLDKGLDIRRIRRAYDEKKRKRLRELELEEIRNDMSGSQELGMQAAYEEMKDRKFKGLGPMSEAADAGMVFAYPMTALGGPLGTSASVAGMSALTNLLDARTAKSLAKSGSSIEPSSSPVIATALLALAGAHFANKWSGKALHSDLNSPDKKPIERRTWDSLIKHVSGKQPLTAFSETIPNAYHQAGRRDRFSDSAISDHLNSVSVGSDLDRHYLSDPDNLKNMGGESQLRRLVRNDPESLHRLVRGKQTERWRDNGLIFAGSPYDKAPVIAHEAGHAKVEATPGIARWLQRNMYGRDKMMMPIAALGSTAAGLAIANPWLGGLAGAGIGALAHSGRVVPELMASYHGLKGLKSFEGGRLSTPGDAKSLAKAYATYLSLTVAPHMLAGAAAGYIGSRRKKKKNSANSEPL